jgi:penicillin-binding protein 1A
MPMTLVVDPETGQQVWVPSAPLSQNQPIQQQPTTIWGDQVIQPMPNGGQQFAPPADMGQQPVYQNENSQRTLMDMIFGN